MQSSIVSLSVKSQYTLGTLQLSNIHIIHAISIVCLRRISLSHHVHITATYQTLPHHHNYTNGSISSTTDDLIHSTTQHTTWTKLHHLTIFWYRSRCTTTHYFIFISGLQYNSFASVCSTLFYLKSSTIPRVNPHIQLFLIHTRHISNLYLFVVVTDFFISTSQCRASQASRPAAAEAENRSSLCFGP